LWQKEDLSYHHQFILHAALDVVQDLAWTTNAMFLKSVDRFNDLVVSVYVTAGHILRKVTVTVLLLFYMTLTIYHYLHFSKFDHNGVIVSLTASMAHTRFMLLHDSRSEDGIKSFFQEVHELYIKVRQLLVIYSKENPPTAF